MIPAACNLIKVSESSSIPNCVFVENFAMKSNASAPCFADPVTELKEVRKSSKRAEVLTMDLITFPPKMPAMAAVARPATLLTPKSPVLSCCNLPRIFPSARCVLSNTRISIFCTAIVHRPLLFIGLLLKISTPNLYFQDAQLCNFFQRFA